MELSCFYLLIIYSHHETDNQASIAAQPDSDENPNEANVKALFDRYGQGGFEIASHAIE